MCGPRGIATHYGPAWCQSPNPEWGGYGNGAKLDLHLSGMTPQDLQRIREILLCDDLQVSEAELSLEYGLTIDQALLLLQRLEEVSA